jgi:hypothetical protein
MIEIFILKRTIYHKIHKCTLTYQKYKKKVKKLYYRLCLIAPQRNPLQGVYLDYLLKKNYLRNELLNSLDISCLPPHNNLLLKINCIVLLIGNLNTKEALVNRTRMCIKFMYRNAIDCEVLNGTARIKRILIPRINLTYLFLFYHLTFKELNFQLCLHLR